MPPPPPNSSCELIFKQISVESHYLGSAQRSHSLQFFHIITTLRSLSLFSLYLWHTKKTFVESFTLTWIYSHKIMHILWWNDWTKCWLLFCCVVHLYEFIIKYDNYRQPIYLCVHLWSLDGMLVTINLLPVYCILILLLFYIHSAFLRSENDGLMKFTSNHSQPFDCEWNWLCCSFGGLSILYTRICKPEWFEILSERTKNVQFNRK